MPTNFQWWISADKECYHGPYLTKELALSHAVLEGRYREKDEETIGIYICEAQSPKIEDLVIDEAIVIEGLETYYEEYLDEDGYLFPDIEEDDKKELGRALNEALWTWGRDRNIRLHGAFIDTRNEEYVTMPNPDHVKKLKEE